MSPVRASKFSRAIALWVAALSLCVASTARAQRSTEQFIPIGQSPGVSQKYTSIGVVEGMSARDLVLTITEPGGARSVRLTPRTRIWLDRSKLKLPNLEGTTADLQPGRRVEIKYENPVLRQVADWVKIEAPTP